MSSVERRAGFDALALTERIRLTTCVLVLPYRNPSAAAKALTTVDLLSERFDEALEAIQEWSVGAPFDRHHLRSPRPRASTRSTPAVERPGRYAAELR